MWKNIAEHLKGFSEDRKIILKSNIMTTPVIEDFIDYLKRKNLMKSTIFTIMQRVVMIHKKIKRAGYDICEDIFDIEIKNELADTIYLTSSEIENVFSLKLKAKELRVIRDLFVIGCLTGMRYSDYSKLDSSNIVRNTIVRKTRKTGESVVIPIHHIVKEIITKNKGFPIYRNTQQNFNKVLKNICNRAGITDEVLIERTIGYKVVRKRVKRYILISSHTARRSFATNAYLAGIPPARIMLLTGHKSEQSFFRYIRINKQENAKTLFEHPFFKNQ